MNIFGEKIILRAIESKDNQMLLEIINDPDTEYMLGGWSFPVSQNNQEEWYNNLKNEKNVLRCTIDVENTAVGAVMLTDIDYKNGNAEVHIKLSSSNNRGKGYGTDALNTIVKYAFLELRLHCIYAKISQKNNISQKLFSKCGFKEEGILKSRIYKKGEYIDLISYSIINNN